ncbi:M15 family metallopeptidase [Cellulomonas sp. NPDC089187]|uniref:M15 family metallopeptidase n=1 Tax=Cellulomonas sp. NPDC089187 TaxID=3154970 RepID=UPI00344762CC
MPRDLTGTRRLTRSGHDGADRADVTDPQTTTTPEQMTDPLASPQQHPTDQTPCPTAPPMTRRQLRALAPPAPITRRDLRAAGTTTLNRADRRRLHRERGADSGAAAVRVATKVAQGAVAVGLAFGVGGFAVATERSERLAAEASAAQSRRPMLSPAALRERQEAVDHAAAVAAQAVTAREAAQASAVAQPHFTSLDEAVAELDTVLAVAQQSQPAFTQLTPELPAEDAPAILIDPETTVSDPAATPTATATAESTAAAVAPEPTASAVDPTATTTSTVEDPAAAQLRTATERVEALTEQMRLVTQLTEQAAADEAARVAAEEEARRQAEEAAAAAAEAERKAAQAASLDAYDNGRIPADALCGLDFASGHQLRCDAAEALEALNQAYRAQFGADIAITDSYRSYAAQVACSASKGSLCAVPGTSNHGNGTAVDLGGALSSFGTAQHAWLLERAQEFGWDLPSWARANGSKPEPWHWEFTA